MAGQEPPGTAAEMLTFAADFAPARTLAALAEAEPLGEVAHYRVPSNRWRRYDKMRRLLAGLLVFGDAICQLQPHLRTRHDGRGYRSARPARMPAPR